MSLSAYQHFVENLPPAYADFKRQARVMRATQRSAVNAAHDAAQISNRKPYGQVQDLWTEKLRSAHKETFDLFLEVFTAELKAGHLEILDETFFFLFITDRAIYPHFIELFEEDPEVFSILTKALSSAPEHFTKFLMAFRRTLSSERVDTLWQSYKDYIKTVSDATGLESLEATVSAMLVGSPALKVLSVNLKTATRLTFRAFFGCLQASETFLEEIIRVSPREFLLEFLDLRIYIDQNDEFKNSVGFGLPPVALRGVHPDFFKQKLDRSGADPEVVELLIKSWEGDLDSLLESSKTLSKEQVQ